MCYKVNDDNTMEEAKLPRQVETKGNKSNLRTPKHVQTSALTLTKPKPKPKPNLT